MVNAVLRKVAVAQKPKERSFESTAAFAERLGHPLWMVERWVAAYGRDAALKICEADQMEHGAGGMFAADELAAGSLPVMDDGSRLVAEIAAAAMPDGLDHKARVWDCCAAPGGKTLILAARLPDAEVLATDVSAKRLAQMEARLRRYEYAERVKCAVIDAAAEKNVRGEFDLILCDVPCSGTGTLAGNPEIRHILKPEEFARQAARQVRILRGPLARLAPGGRLVYSTCSLEAEECEAVVEACCCGWSSKSAGGRFGGGVIFGWNFEGRYAVRFAGWGFANLARCAWVRWIFCGAAGAGLKSIDL